MIQNFDGLMIKPGWKYPSDFSFYNDDCGVLWAVESGWYLFNHQWFRYEDKAYRLGFAGAK